MRPGLELMTRIGIVLPYIVIYEYDENEDAVTIFRIVHGRRSLTAALLTGGR